MPINNNSILYIYTIGYIYIYISDIYIIRYVKYCCTIGDFSFSFWTVCHKTLLVYMTKPEAWLEQVAHEVRSFEKMSVPSFPVLDIFGQCYCSFQGPKDPTGSCRNPVSWFTKQKPYELDHRDYISIIFNEYPFTIVHYPDGLSQMSCMNG